MDMLSKMFAAAGLDTTAEEAPLPEPAAYEREVIVIDEEACTGCGLCVEACHEGAISLMGGKAKLVREHFCDGMGDCLPACPADAITFEKRVVPPYDEAAVEQAQNIQAGASALRNWPPQIKLAPVSAPYFKGANILIAADCTAFAYGQFHPEFMAGRVTLIGCPKLDAIDYTEKLAAIIAQNGVASVTVTRMVVPCCGGLERATREAVARSGRDIPLHVYTVNIDGSLMA